MENLGFFCAFLGFLFQTMVLHECEERQDDNDDDYDDYYGDDGHDIVLSK